MTTNIHDAVAKKVNGAGAELQERIINTLAERELANREAMLVEAVGKVADLDGKLRKVRPDQVQYDADGKVVAETYSKAKVDEKKKLAEQRDKLDAAVARCFGDKPDFDALKKLLDKIKSGKPDDDKAAE